MPPSGTRNSALHHFAAVPHRAVGDKRLKARHFRVLGAICMAVQRETATSYISQQRIARLSNLARQKLGEPLGNLEKWGYITRINRGRNERGRFKTLLYAVHYDTISPALDTTRGDTGPVTPAGDITESPPEEADSDSFNSDLYDESDSLGAGVPDANVGEEIGVVTDCQSDRSSRMQTGKHATSVPVKQPQDQVNRSTLSSKSRFFVAKAKAETFERNQRNLAEKRICDGFFKAYTGDDAAVALDALDRETYEAAVDAEMRQPGAGITMVTGAVRRVISRKIEKDRSAK